MGMRTITEVSQDRLLAVLPNEVLAELTDNLQQVTRANQQMQQFYEQKKGTVASITS